MAPGSACPERFVVFASELADAAGIIARRHFRQPIRIDRKEDASPVTQADRGIEAALRERIEQRFPDHGIIGEEFGSARGDARYVWVLDPIDGTVSFMTGRPLFGGLIALFEAGTPILGIIDQPICGDRWLGARGRRTCLNGRGVATRSCADLADAVLATTSPLLFSAPARDRFESVAARSATTICGGDCINYGLLAAGWLDLVVEDQLHIHDFGALIPVIEGAGGLVTDWQGGPITMRDRSSILASGDARLHRAVLDALS